MSNILVACTETEALFICTTNFSRQELSSLRQKETFICPQCKEQVTLKIGRIMIPHFAHVVNTSCDRLFSEGESQEHLQGKGQLFDYFQHIVEKVELEPYLSNLSQRPDLLFTINNQQFAIEYQCSSIGIEKLLERTGGYESSDIEAIWLFRTPQNKITSGKGIQKVTISTLLQQVMKQQKNHQPFLITYDASKQHFVYLSNLLKIQGQTYVTKVQVLPLMQQQFPFYYPRTLSKNEFNHYWQIYKKSREQFILNKLLRGKRSVQDIFLRSCYELRIPVQCIPYYIGVPICSAEAIPLFSLEWQVTFHYFCKQIQVPIQHLCLDDIQLFLEQLEIEISNETVAAIQNYVSFLEQLKIEQKNEKVDEVIIVNTLYTNLFAIESIN